MTIANGGIGDLQDVLRRPPRRRAATRSCPRKVCWRTRRSSSATATQTMRTWARGAWRASTWRWPRTPARMGSAGGRTRGAHLFKILHGGLTARVDLRTALSTASSLNDMRALVVDGARPGGPGRTSGGAARRRVRPQDPWYWRHRVARSTARRSGPLHHRRAWSLRSSGRASGGTRARIRAAAAAVVKTGRLKTIPPCSIHPAPSCISLSLSKGARARLKGLKNLLVCQFAT